MEAKLSKIGNSQGIIIPKAIIEQCGLKEKIKMEVKNNCLIISSVNPREEGQLIAKILNQMFSW